MKRIQYLIPACILLCLACNKSDDKPAITENIFEADIDGVHWQADSAGATLFPLDSVYGKGYFELKGRTTNGQSFYLTTRSDAPSEAQFEVTYASFKATFNLPVNNGITLNWSTVQEVNADRFEIERSSDAIHFFKAGEVKAMNTASQANYEFHDKPPFGDLHYYRLKAVNTSEKSQYSTVEAVSSGQHEVYFSSDSDTAYHYGFNGTIALTANDTASKRITGTFEFDYVDDSTGTKHTVRNGKFTSLAY